VIAAKAAFDKNDFFFIVWFIFMKIRKKETLKKYPVLGIF
jgi:hypothetical protein